ncbi:MAG: GDP-mannose 4,6-dehydratase [Conexivisphaerales archaeon]
MLGKDKPDDFVIGSGEQHTVRGFVEEAFKVINIIIKWEGEGVNEKGISQDGKVLVKASPQFFRPLESENYLADYSKAQKQLGWKPETAFKDLIKIMVERDIKYLSKK